MNNTKWDELRLAMYGLGKQAPAWRTKDVENGHVCPWDREWFYHFRDGGYASIEWVEIRIESQTQDAAVLALLRSIHVPGHRTPDGFRIYGYATGDSPLDYI